MRWMDGNRGSYVAWVWAVIDEFECTAGDKFDLIDDYYSGKPSGPTATAIRDHYRGR